MRRGVGQTLAAAGSAAANVGGGNAIYDPTTGRYLGGSFWMDLYCGSFLGSSDPACAIPTPAQIKAAQVADLATTSAPPAAIAAAIAAGDAAVASDMTANPSGYIQQCAAAAYPSLSSLIGPSTVGALLGIQPDCTQNLLSGGILWIGVIGFAIWMMAKK
jgi:hypothetical protein